MSRPDISDVSRWYSYAFTEEGKRQYKNVLPFSGGRAFIRKSVTEGEVCLLIGKYFWATLGIEEARQCFKDPKLVTGMGWLGKETRQQEIEHDFQWAIHR